MEKEKNSSKNEFAKIEEFSFFNPEQFATMQRVATMFSNSDLVPEIYQAEKVGKEKAISNCVIALNMANRIKADTLMIMQNLVIIYGRPSWSSKFLISTVNTCGRFNSLKFKFNELGELKDYKYQEYETTWVNNQKKSRLIEKTLEGSVKNIQCIAYTSPKGSDEVLESSPVSIEMAINEGWYTKKGSKWQTMPRQMLMYRAASFWTSAYAPELSMGMKTDDELRDIIDVTYEDISDKTERKIQQEIEANANKEEVDFEEELIQDEQQPTPQIIKQPESEEKKEKRMQFQVDFK